MEIIRKEYSYPSKSGLTNIFARSWSPDDGNVKAVFQITHGMAEHGERYLEFADRLVKMGYAVFVNDHIGHGKSVRSDDELGYFGEKDGWNSFVEDARSLTEMIKKEYANTPIVFFGHSMGSFVAREYAARYGYDEAIKAFIFCGTSGSNPATGAGILLTKAIKSAKGPLYRSKFIDSIAFGSYNNKIPQKRTSFDWLTRDNEIVDKYIADKYCGFLFTVSGFIDMFNVLGCVSKPEWAGRLVKDKPILVVSGAEDPVGAYGKGVRQVYDRLVSAGINDVALKLFDDCRHEIHNELNREDVYAFIGSWGLSKI